MSNRAEILIEDADEGANVRFVFPEGFSPTSAAHQLAQIIQAQLDALAAGGVIKALDLEVDPVVAVNSTPVIL